MAEDTAEVKINPPALHMYTCQQAPAFKLRLKDGVASLNEDDVYAQFEKGVWKTDDDELAKILDKFIATKPHISALVRKVSWAEARRVVSEASKKYHDMNKMIKGATSTADLARNKATTLIDETIAELRAKGTNEEKIKELVAGLQAEGMAVTTIVPEVANAKIDLELQKQTLPGETKTEPAVQPAEVRKPIQFGAKK